LRGGRHARGSIGSYGAPRTNQGGPCEGGLPAGRCEPARAAGVEGWVRIKLPPRSAANGPRPPPPANGPRGVRPRLRSDVDHREGRRHHGRGDHMLDHLMHTRSTRSRVFGLVGLARPRPPVAVERRARACSRRRARQRRNDVWRIGHRSPRAGRDSLRRGRRVGGGDRSSDRGSSAADPHHLRHSPS